MARGHPTDPQGRALPDPSWPPNRTAPPGLEPLRRFCNTTNRESGADRLATSHGLDQWLETEGYQPVQATDDKLRHVVATREAFRQIAVVHTSHALPVEASRQLTEQLGHLRFVVTTNDGIGLTVDTDNGIDHYLGELTIMALESQATATWSRLKACHNQDCQWLYYDHSNNSSGRWCSMQACGGRHKSATYRTRH